MGHKFMSTDRMAKETKTKHHILYQLVNKATLHQIVALLNYTRPPHLKHTCTIWLFTEGLQGTPVTPDQQNLSPTLNQKSTHLIPKFYKFFLIKKLRIFTDLTLTIMKEEELDRIQLHM